MAFDATPIFVFCSNNKNSSPFSQLNLRIHNKKKLECLSQTRKIIHVEYGISSTCPVAVEEDTQTSLPSGFHKDLNFLPKPLSATNISCDDAKVRVAFQGVRGAYSEAAALKAYPKCETVPCDQFEAAFKAVELCLVDKAMIPIENSVDGSIQRNYDLLIRHRLHIVGEVRLIVSHCLLGLPRVGKDEVNYVLSHQQDDRHNITRFLILGREPIIPGTDEPYKTTIVFTLEEGPGVLFKALAVFALRGINLSKIESQPQKMWPLGMVEDCNTGTATYFDNLFLIDFQASMAEPRAQKALRNLQEFTRFLRVLGCYPMDTV